MDKFFKNLLKKIYYFFGTLLGHLIVRLIKLIFPRDKIVTNCFWGSIGHLIPETDYLFQKINTNEKQKVIVFSNSLKNNFIIKKLFKEHFRFFFLNDFLFNFVDKVSINYPRTFIDPSLSCVISHFNEKKNIRKTTYGMINNFYEYYKNRSNSKSVFEKDKNYSDNLDQFFEINNISKGKKLALIHIKEKEGNSALEPTNLNNYIPSINYLNQQNYKIIFVGRERFPEMFNQFDILNYTNFKHVSLFNDLELVSKSSFVLSYASGFSNLPDVMNIPQVYVGSWHLLLPLFSKTTFFLPTLLNDENGKKMKFSKQVKIFHECDHRELNKLYPKIRFESPNAEDLLESVKLAINLKNSNDGKLLNKFKKSFPNTPLEVSNISMAEDFLNKNIDRFE